MPTIALVQMRMSPKPEANVRRAVELVEEAARRGAEIVCLPELFRSVYFPQTEQAAAFRLAEPLDGPSVATMSEVAHRLRVSVIVPLFELRAAGVYHNSLVVLDATGQPVGHYRKMHIPDDPHFYEKFYFAPGDLGFRPTPLPFCTIGTLICWDQWFPEAARLTALAGAQMLFFPTAIGWHESEEAAVREEQLDAWITMQRSHAIASGVFVAAANRVGVEGELTFWGSSFVVNPAGKVIAQASRDREEVLVVECELNDIATQRHGWPFLRDRRVDAYGGLTQRMLD